MDRRLRGRQYLLRDHERQPQRDRDLCRAKQIRSPGLAGRSRDSHQHTSGHQVRLCVHRPLRLGNLGRLDGNANAISAFCGMERSLRRNVYALRSPDGRREKPHRDLPLNLAWTSEPRAFGNRTRTDQPHEGLAAGPSFIREDF